MKLLQTLASLLVASVAGVVASPTPDASKMLQSRQRQVIQYDACPYPKWNISVINFEYTEKQKLVDHRGLDWYGWSGFKRYYGYGLDGWSPNPSNYTTAHLTWDGRSATKFGFRSGPRAGLEAVHSLWFSLGYVGGPAGGPTVPIEFHGYSPSGVYYTHTIHTDPYADGGWEHVCLAWDVYDLTIVVPGCYDYTKGCKYAVFEVSALFTKHQM